MSPACGSACLYLHIRYYHTIFVSDQETCGHSQTTHLRIPALHQFNSCMLSLCFHCEMQEEASASSSLTAWSVCPESDPVKNVFNPLGPVNINAASHLSWAWLLLPRVTNSSDHIVYVK